MRAEWNSYKTHIKLAEPEWELVANPAYRVDHFDAEFATLEQSIAADGVITKDKHLSQMGANVVSPQCIVHLRNYSRAAAIELNIRMHGLGAAYISAAAFQAAIRSISALSKSIRSAPDWVKCALLIGVLMVALNPRSRARLSQILSRAVKFAAGATPAVFDLLASASALATSQEGEADRHLALAMRELSKPR